MYIRDVANLVSLNVLDAQSIGVIRITRFSSDNNMFSNRSVSSVILDPNDLGIEGAI